MVDAGRVGERLLAEGVEGLGRRLEVVVETGIAQAGVLGERVVFRQPGNRRLHAGIVLGEAGEDHALEPGIGHRTVAPQTPLGRHARLAFASGGRRVVEAAVRVLGGKRQRVVGTLEVLCARHKHQRPLDRRIIGPHPHALQGFDQKRRVREIRPALAAVARASVGRIGRALPLPIVPLQPLHECPRGLDLLVVASVAVAGGQCHHCDRRLVVGHERVRRIDAAVCLLEAEQVVDAFLHSWRIDRRAGLHQRRHRERRDGGAGLR